MTVPLIRRDPTPIPPAPVPPTVQETLNANQSALLEEMKSLKAAVQAIVFNPQINLPAVKAPIVNVPAPIVQAPIVNVEAQVIPAPVVHVDAPIIPPPTIVQSPTETAVIEDRLAKILNELKLIGLGSEKEPKADPQLEELKTALNDLIEVVKAANEKVQPPINVRAPAGTNYVWNVAAAKINPATEEKQDTGNTSLATLAGTVSGGKVQVDATISGGDIEIGAVEIKNATTDDRTAVINSAPTTEFGLVVRNIPSGTQAVSAASLPLPTGAATSALQTQPGVDIGDVTINNAAGGSAVNIQDGGNSITVDGTVTVTPSGTQDENLKQVNGATVNVGTGAASTGTQRVAVASDSSLILAAGSAVIGHVIVDTAPTTAITAAALPLPTLASTSTKQSDGSQKTQVVDGSGNVISSTANAIDINVKSGSIANTGFLNTNAAGASAVNIQDGGNSITVDGTVTITPSGTQDENIKQVNGITVLTGTGATGTGSQRVTVAVDSATVAGSASLPAGTNAIGKLSANDGIDIGDVTINNASGASAVNVQDGGNSLTVDYATTGSGNATGALRVELANNGTGTLSTVAAVTAITNALPAGTNLLGKTGIDQTTPGTTNAVSVAQIGANTVNTGTGAAGTGTQRVAVASDSSIILAAGSAAIGSVTVTAADTTATGTLSALGDTLSVALKGQAGSGIQVGSGLYGVLIPEASIDGGTTWNQTFFDDLVTGQKLPAYTLIGSAKALSIIGVGGATNIRVRVVVASGGSASCQMSATASLDSALLYSGPPSTSPPPLMSQVGGTDGSVIRTLQTDQGGRVMLEGRHRQIDEELQLRSLAQNMLGMQQAEGRVGNNYGFEIR